MVAKFPFLSDEWVEAARRLRSEYAEEVPAAPVAVRANLVITDVPFAEGTMAAHLDTSSGRVAVETGHLDRPDVTVTLGYDTARAILVGGDANAAMQAFFGGRIRVDGDLTKLLATMQMGMTPGAVADPRAAELAGRLLDITE
jgi:hypothetical protein